MFVHVSSGMNVPVSNFQQASRTVRRFIDLKRLGISKWTGTGKVTEDGKVIAWVSYNGRVWEPDGKKEILL